MIEVVAGILKDENKVLIAKRASHKSMPGKWEFPGGKIEAREDPKKALERELFEELGIKTKTCEYFNTYIHDYGDFKIKLTSYFTEYLEGDFTLTDHDLIEWVEIKELKNYDLTDADKPIIEKLNK